MLRVCAFLPSRPGLLTALLVLSSCTAQDPTPPRHGAGGTSTTAGTTSGAGGAGSGGSAGGALPSGGTAGTSARAGSGTGASAGAGGVAGNGGVTSGGSAAQGGANTAGAGGGGQATLSDLPTPPGASNVPKPAGAIGGLQVLNWAGFKAAVSYTFDDSNSSQISHYEQLAALGVRFTFYLQTGKSESMNPVWAKALAAGHELGNHTKSHSSNATGSDTDAATAFIEEQFGAKVWTMAAPNGAPGYTELAKTRFLINRGVANALIGPNDNSDPFTLPCYIPPTGASQAALDTQVTEARNAGKWRVVLVHGFTGGTDGAYQPIAFDQFSASVAASKAHGDVWIDSVVNVGAYWRGQKTFSQVSPTPSGDKQTWTWTLPPHFPPGKHLRVTVTGGTLSQNGAALPWDAHGYYEVALDAGSLTLAP